MNQTDTPAKVASNAGLGPLPEARMPDANGAGWFTAGQMFAYAAEQVAAERERCTDDKSGDCSPIAWITTSGRLCLQDGDGPVKAMPGMDEDCDFTQPLYGRHTVADLGRTALALAAHVTELRHAALRALVAWDGTVSPKSHDGLMQERMESLRAALKA